MTEKQRKKYLKIYNATNLQSLIRFLGITNSTIHLWKKEKPSKFESIANWWAVYCELQLVINRVKEGSLISLQSQLEELVYAFVFGDEVYKLTSNGLVIIDLEDVLKAECV